MARVKNPLDTLYVHAKPVRFANATQDETLDGWITLGESTIVSGDISTVPTKVLSISLSETIDTLLVGDDLQLLATVLPVIATNTDVTWSTDQPGTALVDTNGLVTVGPSYGDAIISAHSHDGNLLAQCFLHVKPVRVTIPAQIEAEDFIRMQGIVTEGPDSGNQNLGFIDNRDFMEYGIIVQSAAVYTIDYKLYFLGNNRYSVS